MQVRLSGELDAEQTRAEAATAGRFDTFLRPWARHPLRTRSRGSRFPRAG
jgi:hypothetical protein